jgi:hypothetical protein
MWRRGDKAGCVWKKPCEDGLEVGRVYTVSIVSHGGRVIDLVEHPATRRICPCGEPGGWKADRFRKVVDDKGEAKNECPALLDVLKKAPAKKREKEDA